MISDRYETRLMALLSQTKKLWIKWRPIREYINTYIKTNLVDTGLSQHIQALCTEWYELYLDKSFFVKKDGYTLALLNYKAISAKDGSVHEVLELVGGIYDSPVIRIPEYMDGGFLNLQNAIIQYWEFKKMDYNIEYSDSFELLESFVDLKQFLTSHFEEEPTEED